MSADKLFNCQLHPLGTPGMTNQWLKDQGLLSVKELWINLHYRAAACLIMVAPYKSYRNPSVANGS